MQLLLKKSIVILVLGIFVLSSCQKEKYVTIKPLKTKQALNNPLKGFRPSASNFDSEEYEYSSIVRSYLKWNELERNANDGIERIKKVCNKKWEGLPDKNIKVIPRVYLDWDEEKGNEYWPEDMETGDYTSEQFKQRVKRFVTKLGKVWDNDPRIAWVQMGIIGYWGEQHHPKPNAWQQELLGDLFSEAFQNKKVLVRRPFEMFERYEFGWYWDRFAHYRQAVNQAEPMLEKCPDRWKIAPIEGEIGYGANVGDKQPGDTPNETLQDTSHRKWVIDWIKKVHCSGLGWIAEYDRNNPQVRAGAEQVQKAFGYRYVLKEVTYPRTIKVDQTFSVSFKVENTGSAPFYYDWPVELRLLDPETHAVKWKQQFNDVDIRDWMPGEEWNANTRQYDVPAPVVSNKGTFTIDTSLKKGRYILALAILDPAGMEPSVRFATKQYFTGGNHPIGIIGIDKKIKSALLDPGSFDDPRKDNTLHYQYISE